MQFLYGDSTPSPFTADFVDFLRQAVECCVSVLQAEQRIARGAATRRDLESKAEHEIARLRQIDLAVARAVAALVAGASPDAPATRCSDAVVRAATAVVAGAENDVKSAVAADVRRIEESAARERGRCVKAWERVLLAHDLPGSARELHVEARAGRHAARLRATTPYGVASVVELDVPAEGRFARPVLVGDLVGTLDVQAPRAGWMRKEARVVPHRLAPLVVTSCALAAERQLVTLRDEAGDGFDVERGADGVVRAARVAAGEAAPAPLELADADARALAGLLDALAAAAAELGERRASLADLRLDGVPLDTHAQPSALVRRLIDYIAPAVHELAARSGSPGELVLRRPVADGRREVHFVTLAELRERIEPLPAADRALFAPLALGDLRTPPPLPPGADSAEELSSGSILEVRSGST